MASNKTQKQLHVTLFTFPPFVHHYPDGWRHPQEMLGGTYDPLEPDIWARVARTLESMKVDAFFVGDGGAIYNSNENSPATSLRYGSQTLEFFAPQFVSMVATMAPTKRTPKHSGHAKSAKNVESMKQIHGSLMVGGVHVCVPGGAEKRKC